MQETKKRKQCQWCGRHRYEKHFYLNRGQPRPECKDCTLQARQSYAKACDSRKKGA